MTTHRARSDAAPPGRTRAALKQTARPDEEDVATAVHRPSAGWGVQQIILFQLVCIAGVFLFGRAAQSMLVSAAVLPAVLAVSLITVRSRTVAAWLATWVSLRRRRRRVAAISDEGDLVNPLWLLDRRISIGAIRGFRRTELGVLQQGSSWVSAVWVTDGPRAADAHAADGLTSLLALPPSPAPATTLCAVLQQATTDDGTGPRSQLTAWLSVRAEPLAALPPDEALTAVPGLIRAEIRRLLRETSEGVLRLVPLDRSDVLSALAASTEVPLAPSGPRVEEVSESWQLWQARGRFHHAFELRPGKRQPLSVLIAMAMDLAAFDPNAVLTICIPYTARPRWGRHRLPSVRVSHPDPVQVRDLADEIMDALDGAGAAVRPLSGRHGPALLETSILAGRGDR
jgi:hypothetical protein